MGFFCDALKVFFALFTEISFQKLLYQFSKKYQWKTGLFSMCLHFPLVSFHFTPRSTAFESFSRGFFDLFFKIFFSFSQILKAQIWDEGFNETKKLW